MDNPSKWITKPIYVVSELGIADLMCDGPKNVDALADKTDTHAPTLYRLLRALSSIGIFVETDDRVFLKEAPPVCDANFLVNVLHDWEDEICRRILKIISRSIVADSKLWVVEYLLEPGPGSSVAKLLDIEVLAMGGGRERSIDEYTILLGSAGMEISRVSPTNGGLVLMECILE